ncbi:helix-turn-helix domain-containing protein [Desulfurivibrio sp. D14AmB]|uniref:helix-turn-helix domain-containing protein n=1 Tax=Desulfurivibrio sp. D14AmB TaxID=3374370 RepID=UPI00376F16BA
MSEDSPVYRVRARPDKKNPAGHSEGPAVNQVAVLPSRIFFDPRIGPAPLRVFGLLASVADHDGYRYVHVRWLAECLGLSLRSIQRHLSLLRATGYIVTDPTFEEGTNRQGVNRYRIVLDGVIPEEGRQDA